MKTKKYEPHIFAFSAMFVLGNAIISMPIKMLNIYFLIFSGIISFVLIFFTKLMISLGQKSKMTFYVIAVFVLVLAIWGAVTAFLDFIIFLKSEQLPQANVVLMSMVLAGLIVTFVRSSDWAFYKYSLLVAIVGAVFVAVCFMGGIGSFDFSLSKFIFAVPNFSLASFVKLFLPIMLLPFVADTQDKSIKPIVSGAAVGFAILLVCAVQVSLTIGNTKGISYSYLKAVSVISSGSLFTRLDGLVYFLFFVTAVIKITVCVKVAKKIISNKQFVPID